MIVEVELTKIIIDEKRQDQIIVLKQKNGSKQFPIMIGLLEASSIKMKLSGVTVRRPLTHDLLVSVIRELGGAMDRLVIDKLVDNTFHAKLIIKTADGKKHHVDSRPSDGIALAVRTNAPIFVEENVLKKAAIFKI